MATARQIAANRRNAKKSTGPVSREGRARSARNATRHGLNAAVAVDDTVIGIYRALLGNPEAEPPVAGGAAFEHASLDLARAQVRLQRAVRQLAEADAKVSELVATNGFAGTQLARAWAALMADAGVTAASVVEMKIVALPRRLPNASSGARR